MPRRGRHVTQHGALERRRHVHGGFVHVELDVVAARGLVEKRLAGHVRS
jgi:hypothetical protein